jgi:hypothetical protein
MTLWLMAGRTLLAASIKMLPYEGPGWIMSKEARLLFSLINMPSAKWMRSESEIWPLLLGSDSGMLIRVYAR